MFCKLVGCPSVLIVGTNICGAHFGNSGDSKLHSTLWPQATSNLLLSHYPTCVRTLGNLMPLLIQHDVPTLTIKGGRWRQREGPTERFCPHPGGQWRQGASKIYHRVLLHQHQHHQAPLLQHHQHQKQTTWWLFRWRRRKWRTLWSLSTRMARSRSTTSSYRWLWSSNWIFKIISNPTKFTKFEKEPAGPNQP